jgi:uracil-DNA glycosylase
LEEEHRQGTPVFPPPEHWLRALIETDLAQVRVVILGQDPYHGRNQAIGVAFAVPNALKRKPPSLLNLFKEVSADLNRPVSRELSDLSGWQEQGVLLLNTVLTVREAQPLSHRGRGWEEVTDAVLRALNDHPSPKVFLLWGGPAQAKKEFLTHPAHLVLEAPHPSPLSAYRGFLGCRHFSQANRFLVERRMPAIDWQKTTRTHPVYC